MARLQASIAQSIYGTRMCLAVRFFWGRGGGPEGRSRIPMATARISEGRR